MIWSKIKYLHVKILITAQPPKALAEEVRQHIIHARKQIKTTRVRRPLGVDKWAVDIEKNSKGKSLNKIAVEKCQEDQDSGVPSKEFEAQRQEVKRRRDAVDRMAELIHYPPKSLKQR